jgi:hypothetical protein
VEITEKALLDEVLSFSNGGRIVTRLADLPSGVNIPGRWNSVLERPFGTARVTDWDEWKPVTSKVPSIRRFLETNLLFNSIFCDDQSGPILLYVYTAEQEIYLYAGVSASLVSEPGAASVAGALSARSARLLYEPARRLDVLSSHLRRSVPLGGLRVTVARRLQFVWRKGACRPLRPRQSAIRCSKRWRGLPLSRFWRPGRGSYGQRHALVPRRADQAIVRRLLGSAR